MSLEESMKMDEEKGKASRESDSAVEGSPSAKKSGLYPPHYAGIEAVEAHGDEEAGLDYMLEEVTEEHMGYGGDEDDDPPEGERAPQASQAVLGVRQRAPGALGACAYLRARAPARSVYLLAARSGRARPVFGGHFTDALWNALSSCLFLVLLFLSSSCPPLPLSCSCRPAVLANPASSFCPFLVVLLSSSPPPLVLLILWPRWRTLCLPPASSGHVFEPCGCSWSSPLSSRHGRKTRVLLYVVGPFITVLPGACPLLGHAVFPISTALSGYVFIWL